MTGGRVWGACRQAGRLQAGRARWAMAKRQCKALQTTWHRFTREATKYQRTS